MKKSYSLLSANHLNLNKDIHEKKDLDLANFAIKYLVKKKLNKDMIT